MEPGGVIKLDEDIDSNNSNCIWIVRSNRRDIHHWSHIYLRIENRNEYNVMKTNKNLQNTSLKIAQLTIRKGFHSQGEMLKHIYLIHTPNTMIYNEYFNTIEYVIPVQSAFYIRFQGKSQTGSIKLYLIYSFYKELTSKSIQFVVVCKSINNLSSLYTFYIRLSSK